MNNGPELTYELALSRLEDLELRRTGRQHQAASPSLVGHVRRSLGAGLIAVGRWLAGTGPVTPVAGTP